METDAEKELLQRTASSILQDLQPYKGSSWYRKALESFSLANLEKSWATFKALESLDSSQKPYRAEFRKGQQSSDPMSRGILRDSCTHSKLVIWGIAWTLGYGMVDILELRVADGFTLNIGMKYLLQALHLSRLYTLRIYIDDVDYNLQNPLLALQGFRPACQFCLSLRLFQIILHPSGYDAFGHKAASTSKLTESLKGLSDELNSTIRKIKISILLGSRNSASCGGQGLSNLPLDVLRRIFKLSFPSYTEFTHSWLTASGNIDFQDIASNIMLGI